MILLIFISKGFLSSLFLHLKINRIFSLLIEDVADQNSNNKDDPVHMKNLEAEEEEQEEGQGKVVCFVHWHNVNVVQNLGEDEAAAVEPEKNGYKKAHSGNIGVPRFTKELSLSHTNIRKVM